MKSFYMVYQGDVFRVSAEKAASDEWAKEAEDAGYGEAGKDFVLTYAEDEEEALRLAEAYDREEISIDNVHTSYGVASALHA